MTIRVLHVVPSFFPAVRYGGPIASVLRLCQEAKRAGVELDVATTDANGPEDLDVPTDQWTEVQGLRVRYFHRHLRRGYAVSTDLLRFLAREAPSYDLLHITSTFSFPALAAAWAGRWHGIPYVVSPRGSLQAWSLSQKRWKKAPYWYLLERANLRGAAAIHATAEIERDEVGSVLPGAATFIVPNGVDLDAPPPEPRRRDRIVFLGRIHKKKGFDVLIPALSQVARVRPDVETVVAGVDDEGEWQRVERLLATVTPRPRVAYVGPRYGEEKARLLASASVFVLPSHSENFGQAVVEALACGTPVVVSRNCPWRSVEEEGAGFWTQNTPERVAEALLRILGDDALADRMGRAALGLAQRFSWPEVGRAMAAQYARILGEGAHR